MLKRLQRARAHDADQCEPDIRPVIIQRRGIIGEELPVDRTPDPYERLRDRLYEDRIAMVDSPSLRRELIELERNAESGHIDHPPRGSKDVADAVCGAIYIASRSRIIRNQVGYYDADGAAKTLDRRKQRASGKKRPQGFRRR